MVDDKYQTQSEMPKNKISILCTRPLNELLIDKAARKNIDIDVVGFIETAPTNVPEIIQQITALSAQKVTAVFTSMNAVEAVIKHLKTMPQWDIYCLGGITKELVFDFFGEAMVTATAKNASHLQKKLYMHKL